MQIVQGRSFCVLDMRGDLVASVLALCTGYIDPTLLHLLDLRSKNVAGFNPLSGPGEPYFRALNVLDALESEAESWGVQLAETIRNCLMLLAEVGEPLTRIEDILFDQAFLAACIARSKSQSVRGFWERYASMNPEKKSSLAMPVLNKVSLLLGTQTVNQVLSHPKPLDLAKITNTPGSVTLVSLAVDQYHSAGKMLGKLFLSNLCQVIFSKVEVAESSRVPQVIFVDEFEHFGSHEFETLLAEGRKFGLSLILAHQTLSQLSPNLRSHILNGVGMKVVFRTGRQDGLTMSKDLTQNPNLIDFANVPVGTAAFWSRGMRPVPIAVNAPLLRGHEPMSEEARRYREAVMRKYATEHPFRPPLEVVKNPVLVESPKPVVVSPKLSDSLEDWLCG